MLRGFLALLSAIYFCGAASAALLDVNNMYRTGSGLSYGLDGLVVQTFTPGRDGILSAIEIQLFAPGFGPAAHSSARVSIISVDAGVPDLTWDPIAQRGKANVLATVDLPAGDNRTNARDSLAGRGVMVDFAGLDLSVTTSQQYGILFEQTGNENGTLFWGGAIDNGGYAGGTFWAMDYTQSTPVLQRSRTGDLGFRTFVRREQQPTPVPLPATAGLYRGTLTLAVLGQRALARRRKL